MTAVIRILGCVWLAVAIAAVVVMYGIIWALDGADAAASTFKGPGILSLIGVIALSAPDIVLLALATWLDRQQGRR